MQPITYGKTLKLYCSLPPWSQQWFVIQILTFIHLLIIYENKGNNIKIIIYNNVCEHYFALDDKKGNPKCILRVKMVEYAI